MNRAAREFNTVQSNVTARIRGLEHEFGAALFHHYPHGVTLTPAGDRLMPYARQLVKLIGDAHSAVADGGVPHGKLAVGSMETTAGVRMFPPDQPARQGLPRRPALADGWIDLVPSSPTCSTASSTSPSSQVPCSTRA